MQIEIATFLETEITAF